MSNIQRINCMKETAERFDERIRRHVKNKMFVWLVLLSFVLFIVTDKVYDFMRQCVYFHWSFRIEKFLRENGMTAVDYVEKEAEFYEEPTYRFPSLNGFGLRRFYWKMLEKARKEIAVSNFEKNDSLSLYCFGCYFNPVCKRKYCLTCSDCAVESCERRADGHVSVCQKFVCGKRIEND